jgi:hypothetical protein
LSDRLNFSDFGFAAAKPPQTRNQKKRAAKAGKSFK